MNSLPILLLIFMSSSFFLYSQEMNAIQRDESMVVNSGEAQYDGKEIILVGDVVVQHGLGLISAHRLSVQPSLENDKKNKFGLLKMSDQVQIILKDGGELHCQQAEVDYAKMQGIFSGNQEKPGVAYFLSSTEKEANQGLKVPLEINSLEMILNLKREPATETSSNKTLVKQIEANQNVRLRYNEDYSLNADRAVYQRLPDAHSLIGGLVTLTVKENLPTCQMTNLNGDQLSAQMIQINTGNKEIWLSQTRGVLFFRRELQSPQTLEFSSQELTWNDPQQNLLLKGQVDVNQNGTLRIQTDHQLSVSQAIVNEKKTLRFLHSPRNTQIVYINSQKGNTHKINCPGPFTINHQTQEMSMEGLQRNEMTNQDYAQVHIDDDVGEMYANHVYIQYQWQERQLIPEKMVLEGNIRLVNRFDGHLEESGSILHYALADRMEYFPKEQEMILMSSEGNRVLFLDKVNNVQMSAPSLKVKHDPVTKKEIVQGLGDVRFTFIDKEFDQIKRFFSLPETQEKSGAGS